MKLEYHVLQDGMVFIIWFYLFWKFMFKVALFELSMKLDISQLCYLKKITISYFENLYCTNGSQLAQELREIWMDENYTRCSQEISYNLFIVHYMDACASKD